MVDFFCPRWGSENIGWRTFAKQVKSDGFAGVEVFPLGDMAKNDDMVAILEDNNLSYILLHAEMQEGPCFDRYLDALERNLYTLLSYQNANAKPRFIVSQTGREYHTRGQMEMCFELCDRIANESSIPIIHETHRNKWSYAAHVVKDYLLAFPQLKLALDISHWVCVSESFLEDQQEAVELAIKHAKHIHARVGHTQGPQVTDPRATENQVALNHHLNWWDKWVSYHKAVGNERLTITPEFGPYPYMPYIPNTTAPIGDQYEINCWMKRVLDKRYNQ